MSPSLRALLTGIVDYAGLFPPAQLSLEESIRNYARYRTEPESWMLGRFICPAARLAELSPYVDELFREGPPLAVSALGRSGKDADSFLDGFQRDLADIALFRERHGLRVGVEVYEVRLSADAMTEACLGEAANLANAVAPPVFTPFFEAPPAAISEVQSAVEFGWRSKRQDCQAAGFKLRCGGLEASAFPSPRDVAALIAFAGLNGLPLKFTAGLHHPIRHRDAGIGTMMHGFLNVFVAGVLYVSRWTNATDVLEDEDPGDFAFDSDGLRWRDRRASLAEIEAARRWMTSFGSCSFDEPRDDLRALGFLD